MLLLFILNQMNINEYNSNSTFIGIFIEFYHGNKEYFQLNYGHNLIGHGKYNNIILDMNSKNDLIESSHLRITVSHELRVTFENISCRNILCQKISQNQDDNFYYIISNKTYDMNENCYYFITDKIRIYLHKDYNDEYDKYTTVKL